MIKSNIIMTSLLFVVIATINTGCSEEPKDQANATSNTVDQEKAVSTLAPTTGNNAAGKVTFSQHAKGVMIKAEMTGLTPGSHGFHIHAKGDCSSGDGKSAGGHFNPNAVNHGGPEAAVRHVGDLGNIIADANGNATYEQLDTVASFTGTNNIIGKGVIVSCWR